MKKAILFSLIVILSFKINGGINDPKEQEAEVKETIEQTGHSLFFGSLINAINKNDITEIDKLLTEIKLDINSSEDIKLYYVLALHVAIKVSDEKTVNLLIEKGVDIINSKYSEFLIKRSKILPLIISKELPTFKEYLNYTFAKAWEDANESENKNANKNRLIELALNYIRKHKNLPNREKVIKNLDELLSLERKNFLHYISEDLRKKINILRKEENITGPSHTDLAAAEEAKEVAIGKDWRLFMKEVGAD